MVENKDRQPTKHIYNVSAVGFHAYEPRVDFSDPAFRERYEAYKVAQETKNK